MKDKHYPHHRLYQLKRQLNLQMIQNYVNGGRGLKPRRALILDVNDEFEKSVFCFTPWKKIILMKHLSVHLAGKYDV